MGPLADPKAWVLEELLAEGNTPLELIQACHIPDEVLESAPVLLKQRFALPLLSDAVQGARVPGAALQLVKLLATPQLGWEGDIDALISAVKVQACINVLMGEPGASRRNWKGFAHAVTELFGDGADQSEAAKAAHADLTAVLQPAVKRQRETALEKLLENHPPDPVLQHLKTLLETATLNMPTDTMLKRLEANPYTPQPAPPTKRSETAEEEGGPSYQTQFVDVGVPEDYDGPISETQEGLTPAAAKLGPRRKVTEKRPAKDADRPENGSDALQSSPEQGPPKRGRKPGSKRKRTILSDDETGGSPGNELALIESPKRGPGRPRIHPKPDPDAPKRPRGRPRVYEHGAPPRSPLRRRKSGPARLTGPTPEVASPLGRGVDGARAQDGGEEEEEETTPLKRRRVVADRGGAAGPSSAEKERENIDFPMPDGGADGAHEDSQMEDPLSPPDHQPVHPGGEATPPVGNGARHKGLRMLEQLEAAERRGGEPVDFEMPELGPEEEGEKERGAEFLTMTEDGSNDWCCLCDVKLAEVGSLLLCTGCPNATCYACAGVTETPPLEYICPLCLAKLKRKREKEIRAKLGVIRRPQAQPEAAPASPTRPEAPSEQTLPIARLVEASEPGPSTQPTGTLPAAVPEPGSAEPGDIAGQAIPGQEEMPDLPEEEPGAPQGGELVKADDGLDEKERKARERARTEEGRRNNRYWSDKEVTILREAFVVHLTEENKSRIPWEAIRQYGLRHGVFNDRRGVDLKDKWRNIKRAEDKAALVG